MEGRSLLDFRFCRHGLWNCGSSGGFPAKKAGVDRHTNRETRWLLLENGISLTL